MWQSYLLCVRETDQRPDLAQAPKGRANTFSPVSLSRLDMDWDLSLNSGKQSLCWSLSQSVCFLWQPLIHCHSCDRQFVNLEFFVWHEGFLHNWYQHRPNTYSCLPCRHHSEIPGAPSWKEKLWKAWPLGRGVSEIHKCSWKQTVPYWLMWAVPVRVRRTITVWSKSPI